jgi:hypothetical protein
MYVFLFCLLALITAEKLHQLTRGTSPTDPGGFDIEHGLVALVTVVMAVYLAILLSKISNLIEQTGIVLTEASCVLWFANLLTQLGVAWAEIPHGRLINAALTSAVTVLAGVRAFQVMWHRSPIDVT